MRLNVTRTLSLRRRRSQCVFPSHKSFLFSPFGLAIELVVCGITPKLEMEEIVESWIQKSTSPIRDSRT